MTSMKQSLFLLLVLFSPILSYGYIYVGIAKREITPPIFTPSAGYASRKGEGMIGVHDPLMAIALYFENEDKKLVFCSIDHLGFTYEMTQQIKEIVRKNPRLEDCEVYIGSSHTHSGGGAYLNLPGLGQSLAGSYNRKVTQFYIDQTAEAIIEASLQVTEAKLGIGYGQCPDLCRYRAKFPEHIVPPAYITVFKVTSLDDKPLAVLFNYPVHPTILDGNNKYFSADFVGYARSYLQQELGPLLQPLYFNGAQGDIAPKIFNEDNRWDSCDRLGKELAAKVVDIWNRTETKEDWIVKTKKKNYSFSPQPTPFGITFPVKEYPTELNVISFDQHVIVTIPGELSCIYDIELNQHKDTMGFQHISFFGLTSDAHGYMITPEAWRKKTTESSLCFGGEEYGNRVRDDIIDLLKSLTSSHKEQQPLK